MGPEVLADPSAQSFSIITIFQLFCFLVLSLSFPRYITLQGHILSYFNDEKDRHPRRTIDLRTCFILNEGLTKNKQHHIFSICSTTLNEDNRGPHSGALLRLSSNNAAEAMQWINLLEKACGFRCFIMMTLCDHSTSHLSCHSHVDSVLPPPLKILTAAQALPLAMRPPTQFSPACSLQKRFSNPSQREANHLHLFYPHRTSSTMSLSRGRDTCHLIKKSSRSLRRKFM